MNLKLNILQSRIEAAPSTLDPHKRGLDTQTLVRVLRREDVWAWAAVRVVVYHRDLPQWFGEAFDDPVISSHEEGFRRSKTFERLVQTAGDDLYAKLRQAAAILEQLTGK